MRDSLEPIQRFCKKCNSTTKHRWSKDKRRREGVYVYPICSTCTESSSKEHRKRCWTSYLAQKANARKRPNSEKMTKGHLEILNLKQNGKCALTGSEFDIEDKWYRPSLDRIDSSKGYTLDNIRLVCWIANHCRGDLTDENFIDMCKRVAKNSEVV